MTATETSASGCISLQASASIPVLAGGSGFYPLAPCRLFDTRNSSGADAAWPILGASETRTLAIGVRCSVPASAKTLSVNQTVTGPSMAGDLVLYRGDLTSVPTTSSLSFRAGITRANNGMLDLAHDGSGTFKVSNSSAGTVHFILDLNGYFQ
jgi:hypothetical protein